MRHYRPTIMKHPPARQGGLSLVELMVACTVGMAILLAMSYVLVNSIQSRSEIARTSRQIENGRFAIEELRREVQLAGFYGTFVPTNVVNWTTPDPCTIATTAADLQFHVDGTGTPQVPVGIQGYARGNTSRTCMPDRKNNTPYFVLRRVSTQGIEIDVDPADGALDTQFDMDGDGTRESNLANLMMDGAFYLQVSNCSDLPLEKPFVVDSDPAQFTLHGVAPAGTPPKCSTGYRSEIRRYATRIFYVAKCNVCSPSDGIPTLRMIEVSPVPVSRILAEGIEELTVEYGIDADNNGVPDRFALAASLGSGDWTNVIAVKLHLLARNHEPTPGHKDTKTYLLGPDTVGPFNDGYKRHVYTATVMANNIAGRRMQ